MPSTVRVSDLAKEVGMEPGELLRVLQTDFSLRVRTVSSSIRDSDARKVRNRLRLQQRRASRPDRRLQAAENIRRAAEQRRLREAAEAKARGEAERKAREEAEAKAKEEAEAKAQAEAEEEAARLSAAAAAAEQRAEEERRAEAAAQRAAEEPEAEAAPEPVEPAKEKKAAPAAAPEIRESDVRAGPAEAPVRSERMAAASEKPEEKAAPPPPRRIETRIIASPSGPAEFRPGATDRKIVPAVTRPVRRATPPRIRATPPPMRRTPSAPPKAQRPAPGRRSKGRRRQAPAETPEVLEGSRQPAAAGVAPGGDPGVSDHRLGRTERRDHREGSRGGHEHPDRRGDQGVAAPTRSGGVDQSAARYRDRHQAGPELRGNHRRGRDRAGRGARQRGAGVQPAGRKTGRRRIWSRGLRWSP